MRITRNSIAYEVEAGTAVNDSSQYWDSVNSCLWEPETFDIMQKYLSKNFSYLDIGAWVGPTVLFGAQLAKKCYAFEPDPVAYAALIKNVSLNPGITNIDIHQAAISFATGLVQMGSRGAKGDSMSSLLWSQEVWAVPSFTLNDWFKQNRIIDCNFVKMDIEGGEAGALSSSKDFIKDTHPTLYLSLHIPWITDKAEYFNKIIDSLSVYKNIYLSNGELLSLNNLPNLNGFQTVIATDQ